MSSFLNQYKRQPKIYIDLPSKGLFYNNDTIQDQQFTELPVFGMNTMDEIILKTPDALFTGEATVKIIESCMPHIKDAWNIVSFDLDPILIAIRIASYGEEMIISTTCPHCNTSADQSVYLPKLLDTFSEKQVINQLIIDSLVIQLKPITYKEYSNFSRENFTLQKQLAQIDKITISDSEKEKQRQEIYIKLAELNLQLSLRHIDNISDGVNVENDFKVIKDFIVNNDSVFFKELEKSLEKMNQHWSLPKFDVTCINEECNKTYLTSISMDYSSFFGVK